MDELEPVRLRWTETAQDIATQWALQAQAMGLPTGSWEAEAASVAGSEVQLHVDNTGIRLQDGGTGWIPWSAIQKVRTQAGWLLIESADGVPVVCLPARVASENPNLLQRLDALRQAEAGEPPAPPDRTVLASVPPTAGPETLERYAAHLGRIPNPRLRPTVVFWIVIVALNAGMALVFTDGWLSLGIVAATGLVAAVAVAVEATRPARQASALRAQILALADLATHPDLEICETGLFVPKSVAGGWYLLHWHIVVRVEVHPDVLAVCFSPTAGVLIDREAEAEACDRILERVAAAGRPVVHTDA